MTKPTTEGVAVAGMGQLLREAASNSGFRSLRVVVDELDADSARSVPPSMKRVRELGLVFSIRMTVGFVVEPTSTGGYRAGLRISLCDGHRWSVGWLRGKAEGRGGGERRIISQRKAGERSRASELEDGLASFGWFQD